MAERRVIDRAVAQLEAFVAESSVEELDSVDDRSGVAVAGQRGLELQEAAGIAGRNDVGLQRDDQFGFAVAEGGGGVRLDEIVDASGATADGGFGNFGEFEAGDGREKFTRLRANTLRMIEVAGVVEGDAHAEGMALRARR